MTPEDFPEPPFLVQWHSSKPRKYWKLIIRIGDGEYNKDTLYGYSSRPTIQEVFNLIKNQNKPRIPKGARGTDHRINADSVIQIKKLTNKQRALVLAHLI